MKRKALFLLLLRIFLVISSLLIIALAGSVTWLYLNKDTIKGVVVQELNKSLQSEISVGKLDMVFIRTFPYMSIEFTDILGKEVYPEGKGTDTLFYAKKLYLKFNLIDLYKKNYLIRQLEVQKGIVKTKVRQDGAPNYLFWKETTEENSSVFKLEKIKVSDLRFTYNNLASNLHFDLSIEKSESSGELNSEWDKIRTKADLAINLIQIDSTTFVQNRKSFIKFDLQHESNKQIIRVEKSELLFEKIPLLLHASYCYKANQEFIDLKVKSQDLEIEKLIDLLPQNYKAYLADFKASGTLNFALQVEGKIENTSLPSIRADFSAKGAKLRHKSSDIEIEQIQLQGKYSNGEQRNSLTSFLKIDSCSAQINNGHIRGNFSLQNFEKPFISASFVGDVDMNSLQKLIKSEQLVRAEGRLRLKIEGQGKLDDFTQSKASSLEKCTILAEVSIENGLLQFKEFPKAFSAINTSMRLLNKRVEIKSLSTKLSKSNIHFSGYLEGVYGFLFSDKELGLFGKLLIDQLNLNEFMSEDSNSEGFSLPDRISSNLSLKINRLEYNKLQISNIETNLLLKKRSLLADPFSCQSFNGNLIGLISVETPNTEQMYLRTNLKVSKVDMGILLRSFDNFGQEMFTPENCKGLINSSIQLSLIYNQKKGILPESIQCITDLQLENGELIQITPLQKLSLFLDEKSLQHIHFKTLRNTLIIQDQKIEIPDMKIESNLINFNLNGSHTFDQVIDYHINISLSELASKKQKERLKKEQEEFGVFEENMDGKINLFVAIKGTTENPTFSYDRSSAKKKVKEDLRKERQNLKESLKNALNKEEDLKKKELWKEQEKGKYIIDWEESKIQQEESEKKTKQTKDNKAINIEWE